MTDGCPGRFDGRGKRIAHAEIPKAVQIQTD
jgi:hypothetical protein